MSIPFLKGGGGYKFSMEVKLESLWFYSYFWQQIIIWLNNSINLISKHELNFRKVISPVGWSQRIQPPPPGSSGGHKKSWDQWSQSSLDQTGLGPGPPVIRDPMDLHNLSQASIHYNQTSYYFLKLASYITPVQEIKHAL